MIELPGTGGGLLSPLPEDPGDRCPHQESRRARSRSGRWRLWWLLTATFSLYSGVWAYRQGRELRTGGRSPLRPGSWALLALLTPSQPFVLHQLAVHARQRSCEQRLEPRVSPALVFALSLAIQSVIAASILQPRADALPMLAVLLLPLPFVLVQREVDRAREAAGERAARLSWPTRFVGVLGTIAVAFSLWAAYSGGSFHRLLGLSLPVGEPVGGQSAGWSLAPLAPGWVRVPSGRLGDPGSELELVGPDGESWLVAYVTPAAPSELDAIVARRSQTVAGATTMRSFQERRFFFSGLDLAPASRARYEAAGGGVFHLLVVSGAERSIELVGYGASLRRGADVQALIESLKLAPDGAVR